MPRRVWHEITSITVAGSHLPVVICHRDGLMYVLGGGSFTPSKVLPARGQRARPMGTSIVAGELSSLDATFH